MALKSTSDAARERLCVIKLTDEAGPALLGTGSSISGLKEILRFKEEETYLRDKGGRGRREEFSKLLIIIKHSGKNSL